MWLRALAFVALVSAPGAAWARKTFPDAIATALEGAQPRHVPPCSVCHVGGKTSGATIFTPFAWGMRLRGLDGTPSSAAAAVLQVQADNVDSDGDGTYDADEIIKGTDPNNAGIATDLEDPQLGCRLGGRAPSESLGAAIAFGALAVIRRRAKSR
jgi:hypothetical protein